jgi:ABC-type dipeptide/oligopeptide/nickel transport system permease component
MSYNYNIENQEGKRMKKMKKIYAAVLAIVLSTMLVTAVAPIQAIAVSAQEETTQAQQTNELVNSTQTQPGEQEKTMQAQQANTQQEATQTQQGTLADGLSFSEIKDAFGEALATVTILPLVALLNPLFAGVPLMIILAIPYYIIQLFTGGLFK